jgi:hypothetical protein
MTVELVRLQTQLDPRRLRAPLSITPINTPYLQSAEVPGILLDADAGAQLISAYKSSPQSLLASFSAQTVDPKTAEAPVVAGFSSRGPVITDGAVMLKPDIMAPGVEIFAAVPGKRGGTYMQGTSMSAPHVAGIAALIMARRPRCVRPARRVLAIQHHRTRHLRCQTLLAYGMLATNGSAANPVKTP